MSFPAKFAGTCRGCGGQILVGEEIAWKKDEGAWHVECEPQPAPIDFSGIERFLQAQHSRLVAAGHKPMEPLEPGESAMVRWSREINASVGIYWTQGQGFHGKGIT